MPNTYTDYTSTANQTSFSYSFPVLLESHVAVEINGVKKTFDTDYLVDKTTSVVTLQLGGIVGAGASEGEIVRIRRQSNPSTDLVDFADGSRLSASRLDLAYQHNRYLNEEASEISDGAIGEVTADGSTFLDAQFREIKNLPAPTVNSSAANKLYVDSRIATTTTNLTAFGQDDFTGDGNATAFTFVNISPQVTDSKAFLVNIDGITQNPSNYTISTTDITFGTAPVNLSSITVVTLAGAASVNFPVSFSGDDVTFDDKVTATTFEGDLTGNVTGNVTGDLTGNVTGSADSLTGKTFTTDDTLANASDTEIPTALAVKTHVQNSVPSSLITTTSGTAPYYGCRAWANFDGLATASPVILASGNVASVTRVSEGLYDVIFTTNMPSANYAILIGGADNFSTTNQAGYLPTFMVSGTPTASGFSIEVGTIFDGVRRDQEHMSFAIFA
tara:strand:- start:3795 stop:5129 length:1335 start_codon:yes stop_codon:yes gene_type:complete